MIRNVLEFKELTAKEVMVPRRHIAAFVVTTPLHEVIDHVVKDGHSRYPVYRESLDNIVGLLYVKDLFEVLRTTGSARRRCRTWCAARSSSSSRRSRWPTCCARCARGGCTWRW